MCQTSGIFCLTVPKRKKNSEKIPMNLESHEKNCETLFIYYYYWIVDQCDGQMVNPRIEIKNVIKEGDLNTLPTINYMI